MESDTISVRRQIRDVKRTTPLSSFTFNMETLIRDMKQSRTWAKGELDAMILLRNPEKQILLTAMHKGTEIDSFQSQDSITLKVIEGKLKFLSGKNDVILNEGQFLTLHDKISYSMKSLEETVFLLTIATGI
jgi:quercetin dioxygenase-like cupin family protein